MPKVSVYRVPLSDAWSASILGDKPRPRFGAEDERPYLAIEYDPSGRELSWTRYEEKGGVRESRETHYGADGKPASVKEFFGETGSDVMHLFSREASPDGGVRESERVLYSGELDAVIERSFSPEGKLLMERRLDPEGEELESQAFDEEGQPLAQGDEEVTEDEGLKTEEREVDGALVEETRNRAGEIVSSVLSQKDAAGRIVRMEASALSRGVRHVEKTSFSYQGDSKKPSLMRVERWQSWDPNLPPRPLKAGFRMAVYDEKERATELLLAEFSEGDFESDSYYRIDYAD